MVPQLIDKHKTKIKQYNRNRQLGKTFYYPFDYME